MPGDFAEINQRLKNQPYNEELHNQWYRLSHINQSNNKKLSLLSKYIEFHPKDSLLFQDYITLLSWDTQHELATALYLDQHFSQPQTYMMRALAQSFSEIGSFKNASELYSEILDRNPQDIDAQIGQYSVFILNGESQKVINTFPSLAPQVQQSARIVRLLAQAHQANNQAPYAIILLQDLLLNHPDNPTIIREIALAMVQSGMPIKAFNLFKAHSDYFDLASEQAIRSAYSTYHTRRANNQADSYEQIIKANLALEINIEYIRFLENSNTQQSISAIPAAHADRLTLLGLLNKHREVIDYYHKVNHLNIPAYGLNVVAGSMLATQNTDSAIELINRILILQPTNFDTLQLAYYAHLENENMTLAEEYLQQLSANTATWLYSVNPKIIQPNYQKVSAELMQAKHKAYINDNMTADKLLTRMLNKAPANNEIRVNLATIKRWRNRHKESRELLNVVKITDTDYTYAKVEEIYLSLANRQYKDSAHQFREFKQQHPNHDSIPHIKKEFSIFNSNQLLISAEDRANEGSRFSSREDKFNISFYSQPIAYNWRVLASKSHQHAKNDQFGKATIDQYSIGVDFRKERVQFQIQHIKTDNYDDKDWRIDGSYKINDFWNVGLSSQSFSENTPVRAFAAGITASSVHLNLEHQLDNMYHHSLSLSQLNFSDNNQRKEFNLHADQQLFRNAHHKLFLHENLYAQKNSIPDNSPYFNPGSYYSASVALDYEGILKRHYDRVWLHGLNINIGISHQNNFGNNPLMSVIYHHKYNFNSYVSINAGVGYAQRYYDGDKETGPLYRVGLEYLF